MPPKAFLYGVSLILFAHTSAFSFVLNLNVDPGLWKYSSLFETPGVLALKLKTSTQAGKILREITVPSPRQASVVFSQTSPIPKLEVLFQGKEGSAYRYSVFVLLPLVGIRTLAIALDTAQLLEGKLSAEVVGGEILAPLCKKYRVFVEESLRELVLAIEHPEMKYQQPKSWVPGPERPRYTFYKILFLAFSVSLAGGAILFATVRRWQLLLRRSRRNRLEMQPSS